MGIDSDPITEPRPVFLPNINQDGGRIIHSSSWYLPTIHAPLIARCQAEIGQAQVRPHPNTASVVGNARRPVAEPKSSHCRVPLHFPPTSPTKPPPLHLRDQHILQHRFLPVVCFPHILRAAACPYSLVRNHGSRKVGYVICLGAL
jgi:hypothetical protein